MPDLLFPWQLPDLSEEAKRLLSDPDHLRRKADYIEAQIARGAPLEASRSTATSSRKLYLIDKTRRYRVKELRAQAEQIETSTWNA